MTEQFRRFKKLYEWTEIGRVSEELIGRLANVPGGPRTTRDCAELLALSVIEDRFFRVLCNPPQDLREILLFCLAVPAEAEFNQLITEKQEVAKTKKRLESRLKKLRRDRVAPESELKSLRRAWNLARQEEACLTRLQAFKPLASRLTRSQLADILTSAVEEALIRLRKRRAGISENESYSKDEASAVLCLRRRSINALLKATRLSAGGRGVTGASLKEELQRRDLIGPPAAS